MSVGLILDGLLFLIVLLFMPIGFWRGAVREAFVGAAILLGAAVANAWSSPLGNHLASAFGRSEARASFGAAVAALVLTTLSLGYGAGFALGWGDSTLLGRLGGAMLAACNGALLVGFSLAFVERYLLAQPGGGSLDDGLVAGIFLHRFGWVLAGVGLVGFVTVITAAVLRWFETDAAHQPLAEPAAVPWQPVRPVRVPRDADAGKYEPPVSGAPAPPMPPMTIVTSDQRSPRTTAGGWSTNAASSETSGTPRAARHQREPDRSLVSVIGEHRRGAAGANRSVRAPSLREQPPSSPQRPTSTNVTPFPSVPATPVTDYSSSAAGTGGRCLTCGFRLRSSESYCPECGAAV